MEIPQGLSRRRTFTIVIGGGVTLVAISFGVLRLWGMPAPVAAAFVAALAVAYAANVFLAMRVHLSGWYPSVRLLRVMTAVQAGMPTVAAVALVQASIRPPVVVEILLGAVVYGVAFRRYGRTVERDSVLVVRRPTTLRTLDQASWFVEACRTKRDDPTLPPQLRTVVEINLASGLAQQSIMAAEPEGLDECAELLVGVVGTPGVDPSTLRWAVHELVQAKDAQAARHGNLDGYLEALRLQDDVVDLLGRQTPSGRNAAAAACLDWATYHHLRASVRRLHQDTDGFVGELGQVIAKLEDGLHLVEDRGLEVRMRFMLGAAIGQGGRADLETGSGIDVDVETGIRIVREGLRRSHGQDRNMGRFALAGLLTLAADLDLAGPEALDEAEALGRRLRSDRQLAVVGTVHRLLAQIAIARRERGWAGTDDPAPLFRIAFERDSKVSAFEASGVAREWIDWAVGEDNPTEAAEAYWRLVGQLPVELGRRQRWEDRSVLVAEAQGTAAEAGYWLVRAQRYENAAMAIELSRGMLLTSRVVRIPADLEARLGRAGRPELYKKYRCAAERLDETQRDDLASPPVAARRIEVGEGSYDLDVPAIQHAWGDYRRAVQEVEQALGGKDPGRQLDPATLRAAAEEGPVVYLAAHEEGGYAVVVGGGAVPVTTVLLLGGVDPATVRQKIAELSLVASASSPRPGQLADVLEWLWEALMGPLTGVAGRGSTLTLVPVGALSLLPLHAALDRSDPDGVPAYACDRWRIRYAPNARAFLTARDVARASADRPVLTLDVSPDDGGRALPNAVEEAADVARRYGPGTIRLSHADGTAGHDEVVAQMSAASVWHFACHASANPSEPLANSLQLADLDLTLREILAMPQGDRRLAVLSACRTGVPDPERLDEVISFPGALLYAGVATVVASAWNANDGATRLLMGKFHELRAGGADPVEALPTATQWLRGLTAARIEQLAPGALPETVGPGRRPFADPVYWGAFSVTGY